MCKHIEIYICGDICVSDERRQSIDTKTLEDVRMSHELRVPDHNRTDNSISISCAFSYIHIITLKVRPALTC